MKLRRPLLTMLLIAFLVRDVAAWQFQPGSRPDPYAQAPVPNSNPGFQFAPDINGQPMQPPPAPPPFAPQQFAPTAQQPPQFNPPIQPFNPQPQPAPPMFAAPAGPPLPNAPANAPQLPFIPGYDPTAIPANVNPALDRTLFQPSQIVATVGNQYILYGDVEPTVNQMLAPALARASAAEKVQIEAVRPRLIQQVVRSQVESKLLYLEFERELEAKAGREKMGEIRAEMSKKMRDNFEKQLSGMREKLQTATPEEIQDMAKRDPQVTRLALLMKENNLETQGDLDRILRQNGSTLEKQKQAFLETFLGRYSVQEKIKIKTEVSHLEMLNYYRDHADDFSVKGRARFEILTVKFANFPNRQAAEATIVQMGNDVIFGTPFAAVAKRGSQDINAAKGGIYDWTNEKSLASDQIDAAIFSQEIGKLSPIIEDPKGLHIVRVIERQPAGFIPFTDAQVKIKELITQQRRELAIKQLMEGIKSRTVVWTVYDDANAANVASQPPANQQR